MLGGAKLKAMEMLTLRDLPPKFHIPHPKSQIAHSTSQLLFHVGSLHEGLRFAARCGTISGVVGSGLRAIGDSNLCHARAGTSYFR